MGRKGGYKIIDLKGYDFNSSMVIEGIHERIESSYDKPLLFTGIVIDDIEKNDVFATPSVNGDGYDVTLYDGLYHINNVDVISKVEYNNEYDEEDLQGVQIELLPNKKYLIHLSQSNVNKAYYIFRKCCGVVFSYGGQDVIETMEFNNGIVDLQFTEGKGANTKVILTTFNGILTISTNHSEL